MLKRRMVGALGLILVASIASAVVIARGASGAPTPATSGVTPEGTVSFRDADIEAAVRVALDQPTGELTVQSVSTIQELDLAEKRIQNLSGLEACTGLTKLNLASNFYVPRPSCISGWSPDLDNVDLAPLGKLTRLEELDLTFNDIGDISALAPLTNLRTLNLSSNRVQNLTPLQGMGQLQELHIAAWGSEDYTPLAQLRSLERLVIGGGNPSLFSALGQCPHLKELTLWGMGYEDPTLRGVGELRALERLTVRMCDRQSLEGIQGCRNLRFLDMSNNAIDDLTPLASLPKLEEVLLSGNASADLTPLGQCRRLKKIEARYMQPRYQPEVTEPKPVLLKGLGALAALPDLEELHLGALANGESVQGLMHSSNLRTLELGHVNSEELAVLGKLPRLESLSCAIDAATDLSLLASAPNLRFAGLSFTDKIDFEGLAACDQITQLSLAAGSGGPDLAGLAGMERLTELSLTWEDGLWDLAGLGECASLRSLTLSGNSSQQFGGLDACDQIETISVPYWYGKLPPGEFSGMANLRSLEIRGGERVDLALFTDLPQLNSLAIQSWMTSLPTTPEQFPALKTLNVSGTGMVAEDQSRLEAWRAHGVTVLQDQLRTLTPEEVTQNENYASILETQDWSGRIGGSPMGSTALPVDPLAAADDPVTIPDEKLRGAISSALGVEAADLTTSQLARLQTLSCGNSWEIVDLTGLEHCRNLTHLDLGYNPKLTSIAALTGLPRLESLNLENTTIADLTPLASCPLLREVNLGSYTDYKTGTAPVPVPDLTPLSEIPALRRLGLAYSSITDLTGLVGCEQLEELVLNENPTLTDLSPLAGLTSLRHLNLNGVGASDLRPLRGLVRLEFLHHAYSPPHTGGMIFITGNRPSAQGIGDLSALSSLRILRLNLIDSVDLTFLESMPDLEELALHLNPEVSLHGIGGHPRLRTITLSSAAAQTLDALTDLPALEELEATRFTYLTDVSALAKLPRLKKLNLSTGGLRDYSTLAGCTGLEDLVLSGNPGVDVTPLAALTALRSLELSNLGFKPNWTDLPNNGTGELTDIAPLAALTKLESLRLFGAAITDVTPLAGLAQLRDLSIYGCQVADLLPLAEGAAFAQGGHLSAEGNPLSDESRKKAVDLLGARGVQVMY